MNRAVLTSLVLGGLLLLAFPLCLMAGQSWIDPFGSGGANATVILAQLRLPRAVLALIVGAGLGASGAAMQGYLRNPLADPGLFGVAPLAALGAVLSLFTGYAVQPFALPAGRWPARRVAWCCWR